MEGEAEMSPTLRHYIEDRVGFYRADDFERWAFGKVHVLQVRTGRDVVVDWNKRHKKWRIDDRKGVWDSVDKMIYVWNERFK